MQKKQHVLCELCYWLVLGLLMAISVLLLFKNLGALHLQWADESRHGVNAYEMMESGDWVVSTYRGETDYWNLKPPLSMWAIMLGFKIFGYNAFGLRVYSALSMLALMGLMALWIKSKYGNVASLIGQLFWMGCSLVYGWHFARFGDADAMYVLFYTLSMLCMLESQKDVKWLYGTAVFFGLAFMAKSWHAALIPVTALAYVIITRQIQKLRVHHYILLIVFGLLPIAPWAIARIRFDGLKFFTTMLETDVFTRATTVHEKHEGGVLYYLKYLCTDPATILAMLVCLAFVVVALVKRKHLTNTQWGLLLWTLVPIVLYTLCVSKLEWYVFPCLPPLAIGLAALCGKTVQGIRCKQKGFWLRCGSVLAVAVFLCVMCAGQLQFVFSLKHNNRYDLLIESFFQRERDSGIHTYIQYEAENPYAPIDYREWMQGDVCAVEFMGDAFPIDGGAAAFAADPEPAYLIAHDVGLEEELLGDSELIFVLPPLNVYYHGAKGE